MTDAAQAGETRVAVCQICPDVDDPGSTLQRTVDAIEDAAARGANVVVLPELSSSGYMFRDKAELRSLAQKRDGRAVTAWAGLAQRHDLVVVAGLAEDDGELFNSAVLIDAGELRAVYRKAHLWDSEKTVGFTPGDDEPPVIETAHGRIAVMICYDAEFPEWVRLPALAGADLLCVPANWPLYPRPAGERPGEIIRAQANAAVNRMFVAVADRAGTERGQQWTGGSVIIDADGYPVAGPTLGAPTTLLADLRLSAARDKHISAHNDVHADRRPELYRAWLP
ncbi:MAG: carbon-nitrogen hydrolase [Actinobacteria bacterium 69-20]|nr:carbon-nitrogen hydrolase [Actinomycetota bacterium]OJV27670.1 MAG: carbon-nitrogen hydrolase [Actinobacteria bacterium 69-20]